MTVHYSSASKEWYTPPHILKRVVRVLGAIDLDPCSDGPGSLVPAARRYTRADDGLRQPWAGRVYLNPPYGDEAEAWVRRLHTLYTLGSVSEAIALLPARTDTAWFQPLWDHLLCFYRGRLKFSNATSSAPFPSVLVYFGRNRATFAQVFSEVGVIVSAMEPRRYVQPLQPDFFMDLAG